MAMSQAAVTVKAYDGNGQPRYVKSVIDQLTPEEWASVRGKIYNYETFEMYDTFRLKEGSVLNIGEYKLFSKGLDQPDKNNFGDGFAKTWFDTNMEDTEAKLPDGYDAIFDCIMAQIDIPSFKDTVPLGTSNPPTINPTDTVAAAAAPEPTNLAGYSAASLLHHLRNNVRQVLHVERTEKIAGLLVEYPCDSAPSGAIGGVPDGIITNGFRRNFLKRPIHLSGLQPFHVSLMVQANITITRETFIRLWYCGGLIPPNR